MLPVSPRIAIAVSLVLVLALFVGLKEPAPTVAAEPDPKSSATDKATPYDHTAIGVVLKANYGHAPRNGTELMRMLKKVGNFATLPVPFSAVNATSSLTTPRVIIAPRPGGRSMDEDDADPEAKDKLPRPVPPVRPGVLPGFPELPGVFPGVAGLPAGKRPIAGALSQASATEPVLDGRLYFAANMEKDGEGTIRVKTIEFISWNARDKRFDFGVIECNGDLTEVQILDGVRCFTCHKNKGPILGQGPWSNTTHNDHARVAALRAFFPNGKLARPGVRPIPIPDVQAGLPGFPMLTPEQIEATTFDGISLVAPEPEVCDASIRIGAELARDRDVYRVMTKSPDGRKALIVLLTAIASPGAIEQNSAQSHRAVDLAYNINSANFAEQFVSISKNSSSMLADFSPSGSMGGLRTITTNEPAGWGSGSFQRTDTRLVWGGDTKTITEYESKRSAGDVGMPSHRQPSNPRAFVRPTVATPPRPSSAANAIGLARMIGLTEGDRKYMANALSELALQIGKPKITAATLAKDVFNSPTFLDVFKVYDIPDREEFKDRFAEAIAVVAKANKISESVTPDRKEYASGPSGARQPGQEVKELPIIPTTACQRCHDIRGVGKPAFNPIPMLAFDPFDKDAREKWVKFTDAKKRTEVLSKLTKRLVTDTDMPPEDSPEHEKYRLKDKPGFEAVKEWLDAELKRAKGN